MDYITNAHLRLFKNLHVVYVHYHLSCKYDRQNQIPLTYRKREISLKSEQRNTSFFAGFTSWEFVILYNQNISFSVKENSLVTNTRIVSSLDDKSVSKSLYSSLTGFCGQSTTLLTFSVIVSVHTVLDVHL